MFFLLALFSDFPNFSHSVLFFRDIEHYYSNYSFYICANDKYREIRGKEIYEGKTLYELNEEDGKRGQYYQYYTGNKWGDPQNYNLIINTSDISLDEAADIIINYVEMRQKNNI